jgi:hypothetical protein
MVLVIPSFLASKSLLSMPGLLIHHENGGKMLLQNSDTCVPNYMMSSLKVLTFSHSYKNLKSENLVVFMVVRLRTPFFRDMTPGHWVISVQYFIEEYRGLRRMPG